jgi:branched-chain amino acid aminotransferase
VREVDNRCIGSGKPGPVTKAIQNTYFDAIHGKVDRYRSWLTKV